MANTATPHLSSRHPYFRAACLLLVLSANTRGQADDYEEDQQAQTDSSSEPVHFVIVSKTHFDIGYSALARDVIHEYRTTMIDRALATIEQNAKITVGSMDDFADALLAERPRLPVVRGNISDSWIHGAMSSPQAASELMNIRTRVRAMEALRTQNMIWGVKFKHLTGVIAKAYDNSLCPAGTLPVSARGVSLSRTGVLLTAFGPNPDGNGTLLRIWEDAGQSGELTVALPAGLQVDRVQPIDLRGRTLGEAIAVTDGKFTCGLGKYEPKSFLISPP